MEVTVAFIIPVWNGRDLLAKLLASIAAQTLRPAEVIVVDNGSTDGAPALAEAEGAKVISMGKNAGFAAAVNRGVRESHSDWLAIVNSDVELAPDWLARLVEGVQTTGAWFGTGKILSASDRTLLDGTWDLMARSACPWRAGEGKPDAPLFSVPRQIGFASFTAILLKSELFQEIGGLEERFESYLEDVDFGLRCALGEKKGTYVPAALSYHRGSATLGRWHGDSTRRMARNQVLLLAKHYPRSLLLQWWWPILAGQALWGLLAFRHGAGFAFCLGKWQGLRQFRAFRQQGQRELHSFLLHSEGEIRTLQQQNGWDFYWRMYFLLTGAVRPNDTAHAHE